jgi:hypothetical protein
MSVDAVKFIVLILHLVLIKSKNIKINKYQEQIFRKDLIQREDVLLFPLQINKIIHKKSNKKSKNSKV